MQLGVSSGRIVDVMPDTNGDSELKIAVPAPPDNEKANAALVFLLSKRWKIARSYISIIKGVTERRKTVHIAAAPDRLRSHLKYFLEGAHG